MQKTLNLIKKASHNIGNKNFGNKIKYNSILNAFYAKTIYLYSSHSNHTRLIFWRRFCNYYSEELYDVYN